MEENMPQNCYELVWIFIIYAFIGWCTEVSYAALDRGIFVNRGFLNGPYCPIYGCGVVIVVAVLTPLKDNLLILFIGSFLLTSILEYITGYLLEKVFHNQWWDYSDKPFNIHGYVCLKFSIYWGLACTFIMDVLHPIIYKGITLMPHIVGMILICIIMTVFFVDCGITVATILKFNKRLKVMDEMAERKHKFPMLTLSDGDTLYLAGQSYKLDVRLGLQNSIRRSGQTVFMELADDTPVMRQKLYHKLLQALGKKLFPASLSRMQPLFAGLALPDPVLKQRVMRSRWGSCMPLKGIVTMNTYLAIMPEAIIDHVMLHELCHFIHPNHSRHFYDVMTVRMPDWKERCKAMNRYLPYCI